MFRHDEDDFLANLFDTVASMPVNFNDVCAEMTVYRNKNKNKNNNTNRNNRTNKNGSKCENSTPFNNPRLIDFVDHVICQDNAVVVFWTDGMKTTAKCSPEDTFDYEKGLAMAAIKWMFGNSVYRKDILTIMEAYPRTETKKNTENIEDKTNNDVVEKKSESKKSESSKKSSSKKSSTKKKKSN